MHADQGGADERQHARGSRSGAAAPSALEAVDQRIEQVRDHEGGGEGRERALQHEEQREHERRDRDADDPDAGAARATKSRSDWASTGSRPGSCCDMPRA